MDADPIPTRARAAAGLVAALALAVPNAAQEDEAPVDEPLERPSELEVALRDGRVWLELRGRYENVEDDAFGDEANATTLRTALGFETGSYEGFSALLEFEDVSAFGDERYDSLANGMDDFPLVPDPDGTEVNRALVRYVWGEQELEVRAGRQYVSFDDGRIVGIEPWRQNRRSYDAVSVSGTLWEDTSVTYSYLHRVHDVFGFDDPDVDEEHSSHLVHAERDFEGLGTVAAYLVHLDVEDRPDVSTRTVGARFTGSQDVGREVAVHYLAEYADQDDVEDNPLLVDADYWHGAVDVEWRAFVLGGGLEHLGGSETPGDRFTTPLASTHEFLGWADQFDDTPDGGVEDLYVHAGARYWKAAIDAYWHEFESDATDEDLGSELDVRLTLAFGNLTIGAAYADFGGEGIDDVSKFWGWVSYSLF